MRYKWTIKTSDVIVSSTTTSSSTLTYSFPNNNTDRNKVYTVICEDTESGNSCQMNHVIKSCKYDRGCYTISASIPSGTICGGEDVSVDFSTTTEESICKMDEQHYKITPSMPSGTICGGSYNITFTAKLVKDI